MREVLPIGNERAIDGAHGEVDAIVRTDFLHEFAYMSLYSTLLNAKLGGDFAIGAGKKDEFEYLLLADRDGH